MQQTSSYQEKLTPERVIFNDAALKKAVKFGGKALETAGVKIERDELLNHDPLAHVWLLAEKGISKQVEKQIYTEFITDIGERAQLLPFDHQFAYSYTGDDFIADTGISMRQLLDFGLVAAQADYRKDPLKKYALERAEVQAKHFQVLKDWFEADSQDSLLIASLAPSEAEAPVEVAKAAGFKTERQMASMWLFEKDQSGEVVWRAFSLDQYVMDDLRQDLVALSAQIPDARTTLELLSVGIRVQQPALEVQSQLTSLHDARLEQMTGKRHTQGIVHSQMGIENANQRVIDRPEVFELYRSLVVAASESIKSGLVTIELANLAKELREGFEDAPIYLDVIAGQQLHVGQLRKLFDYVRKQAIPHYVFNTQRMGKESYASSGGSIAQAGAEAVNNKVEYEGACPSSGIKSEVLASFNANPDAYALRSMAEALGLRLSSSERAIFADFGTTKEGVCRFSDCSSRGVDGKGNVRKSNARKTTVGGCDLCVMCHVTIKEEGFSGLRKKHKKIIKQWQSKIQKAAAKPLLKDNKKQVYARQTRQH